MFGLREEKVIFNRRNKDNNLHMSKIQEQEPAISSPKFVSCKKKLPCLTLP